MYPEKRMLFPSFRVYDKESFNMKKLIVFLSVLLIMCLPLLSALAAADRLPTPFDVIPYDEIQPNFDGQHHYLLLCEDVWTNKAKKLGNTDGIVLVTLDTRAHRVMLTSFIRDAIIRKPDSDDGLITKKVTGEEGDPKADVTYGRINYIAKNYSPETLCSVISQHINVKVEKNILFNFSQIQDIIDYLGGVDITINASEASYLTRYAISKTSTKPAVTGAGTYRFGGHAAVIYMRIRKAGGGGDFMRTQRVRTVLSTLADQCREISYDDAVNLAQSVMEHSTRTNMNMDDMLEAVDYAFGLRGCTVEELRLPPDGAATPITFAAMAVQEIDWAACRAALEDYLQNSFLVMADEDE